MTWCGLKEGEMFFTLVSPPETDEKSLLSSWAIEEQDEEETRLLEHSTSIGEGWWRG